MLELNRRISQLTASVRGTRRDALRLATQTAAASAAAYLVMIAFGLPHVTWAVIAALFTIHPNADSTLWTGLGRLLSTVIGIAIGLVSIMAVGGEEYLLVRLLIAAAAAGGIAAIWPNLNYVGVVAVVMALHPDPELDNSLLRALAIMIGAVAGTMASLVLWPEFGARRTVKFVETALEHVRDLLDLVVRSVDAEERRERDAVHAQFLSTLETARQTAAESWFKPRLASGATLRDALRAVEGLWHGIVILDRVVSDEKRFLDEPVLSVIRPTIEEVRQAACAQADALTSLLDHGHPEWPRPSLAAVIRRARQTALEFLTEHGRVDDDRSRSVHALVFALDEVERSFTEVARLILSDAATSGSGTEVAEGNDLRLNRSQTRH